MTAPTLVALVALAAILAVTGLPVWESDRPPTRWAWAFLVYLRIFWLVALACCLFVVASFSLQP